MSKNNDESSLGEGDPSRRKFLKVSVVTGATVAALAVSGAIPMLASSAAAPFTSSSAPSDQSRPESAEALSGSEAIILVVRADSVDVYRGENKYPILDTSFVKQIKSNVNSRIASR